MLSLPYPKSGILNKKVDLSGERMYNNIDISFLCGKSGSSTRKG